MGPRRAVNDLRPHRPGGPPLYMARAPLSRRAERRTCHPERDLRRRASGRARGEVSHSDDTYRRRTAAPGGATRGRTQADGLSEQVSALKTPDNDGATVPASVPDLGVTRQQSSRWQAIAALPEPES